MVALSVFSFARMATSTEPRHSFLQLVRARLTLSGLFVKRVNISVSRRQTKSNLQGELKEGKKQTAARSGILTMSWDARAALIPDKLHVAVPCMP